MASAALWYKTGTLSARGNIRLLYIILMCIPLYTLVPCVSECISSNERSVVGKLGQCVHSASVHHSPIPSYPWKHTKVWDPIRVNPGVTATDNRLNIDLCLTTIFSLIYLFLTGGEPWWRWGLQLYANCLNWGMFLFIFLSHRRAARGEEASLFIGVAADTAPYRNHETGREPLEIIESNLLLKQVPYSRLYRKKPWWVLIISREGDSTACLGCLFQCSVTPKVKKIFHVFIIIHWVLI